MIAAKVWQREHHRLTEMLSRVYHRLQVTPPADFSVIVDRMFIHYALVIGELLRFPLLTAPDLSQRFIFHGVENLDRALSRGKGVILVVPHLGNWEMLGAAIAHRGYPLNSFYLAQKEGSLGAVLDHFRSFSQIILHDRDRGGLGGYRALKKGELLGMIADQDGNDTGVYVNFLGHWVSMPAGPANWSLRSGAALVPLYCLRDGWSGRYNAWFLPSLEDETAQDPHLQLVHRTAKVAQWMEQTILAHPSQYLWFYDRFRPRHEGFMARLKREGHKMEHGKVCYGWD